MNSLGWNPIILAVAHSLRAAFTTALCQRAAVLSIVAAIVAQAVAPAVAAVTDATSSQAARDEAVRAIPWRNIAAHDRRTAQFVINNASIYRRLPTRVIDCDPDMFTFLIQHPEVIIDVWRVMGISQVKAEKLPGGVYRGNDGAGTSGTVRYLYANWGPDSRNTVLVFADGAYEGKPFVTPLRAQSLLLLRSSGMQESNGRHYVSVRIDTFVRIEQLGIELVAKTVQPWINSTADRNFVETLSFVSKFSRTAQRNPQGMQRLATRLTAIDDATRKELVAVCFRAAERYAHHDVARTAPLVAQRATAR